MICVTLIAGILVAVYQQYSIMHRTAPHGNNLIAVKFDFRSLCLDLLAYLNDNVLNIFEIHIKCMLFVIWNILESIVAE